MSMFYYYYNFQYRLTPIEMLDMMIRQVMSW